MFYCGQCAEYRDAQKLRVFGVSPRVRGGGGAQYSGATSYVRFVVYFVQLHVWTTSGKINRGRFLLYSDRQWTAMHIKVFQVAKRKYLFGEVGLKLKCYLRELVETMWTEFVLFRIGFVCGTLKRPNNLRSSKTARNLSSEQILSS
jgi:hypothetical protein